MNRRIHHTLLSAGALLLGVGALAPACLNRPIGEVVPRRTSTYNDSLDNGKVDKIDILISVDDSGSMADKQAILALAVPQLIESLVNPLCLPDDAETGMAPVRVAGPTDDCPVDMHREFEPVLDIHVGVIGSSLDLGETGYHLPGGASTVDCVDRKAHLLTEVAENETPVTTYQGRGYLAWDPEAKLSPPGDSDMNAFIGDVTKLVVGVGQDGCGYEASLESWYRFLVDPQPAEQIVLQGDKAVPDGQDSELLAQREAFLRPDSLVAIVMLTDENDCSTRPGYGYLTARAGNSEILGMQALVPRSVCDSDPASECCAPCQQGVPEHCGADPACSPEQLGNQHARNGLYCHNQKRRFGIDLLQPTERYIDGLTSPLVPNRNGELVDNPLFVSPDGTVRPSDRVFLAGIVGVPYQAIARDPEALGEGLMTFKELTANEVWTDVAGSPKDYVAPRDSHMIESPFPRPGLPLAGAGEIDAIHGFEHGHGDSGAGDLQYSCIFDLPTQFHNDCATASCDCADPTDNPLCIQSDGSYTTVQRRAKAYPGLRHLEVLRGIEDQGIVGSICAKQLDDNTRSDFGYNPAIGALVDRLAEKLVPPCLPRPLKPNKQGQVSCLVLEGRQTNGGACDCTGIAREPVPASQQGAITAATSSIEGADAYDCFCKVQQLADAELNACQNQIADEVTVDSNPVHGWCYIDERIGEAALVESCESTKRQTIRLVGEGQPGPAARHFITCATGG
jgi:hypothetical protein